MQQQVSSQEGGGSREQGAAAVSQQQEQQVQQVDSTVRSHRSSRAALGPQWITLAEWSKTSVWAKDTGAPSLRIALTQSPLWGRSYAHAVLPGPIGATGASKPPLYR